MKWMNTRVFTALATLLLGLLPISGANTTRDAIQKTINSRNGDALINITIDAYSQYWILFSRYVTRVEGDVIRFQ